MKLKKTVMLTALILALGASALGSATVKVREIGSYSIGGQEVSLQGLPNYQVVYTKGGPWENVNPNGQFEVGQMYVHFVKLTKPKAKYPLMMWHGGGFTGSGYESTPDGRPGWQMFFLNAGHDVYLSDAVERGRSGWAQYPQINPGPPMFRTKEQAWTQFRIGKTYNADNRSLSEVYAGQQFPVESFDNMMKQSVPRWTTSDAWAQAAYNLYVSKFSDGCVIMAHSQSGNFAINAALANPSKVKGLIFVEPSGAPHPRKIDVSALKKIPHLYIWGDYMTNPETPNWAKQAYQKAIPTYRDAIIALGGDVTWVDLPKIGILGNSHMMFLDKNSDVVAKVINDWMIKKGLVKK